MNGANPSPDYERRRSSGTGVGSSNSPNTPHMRAAASVDRLNMMSEGTSGRKLPSMPDSIQRSPMKISGREGEIAALKRSNRRSASSHNLVNNAEGKTRGSVVIALRPRLLGHAVSGIRNLDIARDLAMKVEAAWPRGVG